MSLDTGIALRRRPRLRKLHDIFAAYLRIDIIEDRMFPLSTALRYIAVLVPESGGKWRSYLPDFPECRATGATPDEAVRKSKLSARELIGKRSLRALPTPRSLGEIQDDRDWASKRAIEWENAIVSLVSLD